MGGVSARLQSLPVRPNESNSAVIWTSIATGKRAAKHGIEGFVGDPDPATGAVRLYTQDDRRVKAFWNILSEKERTVSIVGWWVTWPAEPVNGTMLSYNFWPARFSTEEDCRGCPEGSNPALPFPLPRSAYPDAAAEKYAPLVVTERDLVDKAAQLIHEGPDGSNTEYWAYARDLSMFRLAREVLKETPDVCAVYFESPDIIAHKTWMPWTGEDFYNIAIGSWANLPEPERRQLAGRLERYYSFVDRSIGELQRAAPAGARTMVVSDHGFETYEDMRKLEVDLRKKIWQMTEAEKKSHGVDATASFGHSAEGVFILQGNGVAKGKTLERATIYDVAPTVLYLQGLPAARDMDGRVLEAALEPGGRRPAPPVKTYETGKRSPGPSTGRTPDERYLIERLKTLGYLSGPSR